MNNTNTYIIKRLFSGCEIIELDNSILIYELYETSFIRILNNFCKSQEIEIININHGSYLLSKN